MLFVPSRPSFFNLSTLSATSRPATGFGASVNPGTGAYGNWAALGNAMPANVYDLQININNNFTSGASSRLTVVRIGMDPAGGTNYTTIINNLLCGGANAYTTYGGVYYSFPIFIPSGATLAASAYGSVTTAFTVLVTTNHRLLSSETYKVGSYTETLGIGTTAGTAITPGTTSEGTWTSIGTTTKPLWWWQFGMQVAATTTVNLNAIHVDLAVGDGSTFDIIVSDLLFFTTTTESVGKFAAVANMERYVPAGSTIYARAQASGTLNSYTLAVYGLGG